MSRSMDRPTRWRATSKSRLSRPSPFTTLSPAHVTLFAVNRVERPLVLEARSAGFDHLLIEEHRVLGGTHLRQSNTADDPLRVTPFTRREATVAGRPLTVEHRRTHGT